MMRRRLTLGRRVQHAKGSHPRTVDFSGVQLTIGTASVLSDVFTIEWGLRKLVFKECDLDDQVSVRRHLLFDILMIIFTDFETDFTLSHYTRDVDFPVGCIEQTTEA